MDDQFSIVLIDAEEESRQFMKETFAGVQHIRIAGEAADLGRGFDLVRQFRPTIVMIDLYPSLELSFKLAEKIMQNFPQTVIFITAAYHTDSDTILKAMRVGAREFISKPYKADALLNAVKTIVRLKSQTLFLDGLGGQVITVFGVRGGIGTTMLATNLAVNLAKQTDASVVLLDLKFQFGNAALFMNIVPKYSILDISYNLEELDPAILKDFLPRHKSGVWFLGGPANIEDSDAVTSKQFEHILLMLKSQFDYVVVDANTMFDDMTLKTMDDSDTILTLSTGDLPAVSNTIRCLHVFRQLNYSEAKVRLVINRYDAANMIPQDEFRTSVKAPVFWKIPNQGDGSVINSINKGVPISLMNPRAKVSQSIEGLTMLLHDRSNGMTPGCNGGGRLNLVKKLLMRV